MGTCPRRTLQIRLEKWRTLLDWHINELDRLSLPTAQYSFVVAGFRVKYPLCFTAKHRHKVALTILDNHH